MIKFRDPQSNIQLAEAELTYKEAVNGEKSLTGTIYSNDDVLHQMERGWSVMFNGDWYYITYVAPTDGGNSITVEFDAVHEFFFKMSKSVAYGTLKDGSHTAKEYLDFVFNGSEYSYTLLSQVDAWEKQSFGDKNRLALFNDLISDMEMEFSIADSGRIMITSEIGQDLSTIVRKGFNLQELNLEYNVSDFVTYAKGFGAFIDKDDESKGRYEAEYTSPLASVYGKLEADPITDERYTVTASLQAALKKAVDSSYSISVGISLEELQSAGYDYDSPVPGDYILAVDEQLDFNQRIRIISVEEQYNVYGERISSSVEAGSLSATKQKLDGSESNSVDLALSHATEQANNAVNTANGKNTNYYGPNEPQNPREGDMWWYDNGSGTSFMKQYTNGEWVTLVDSNTKKNIENAVDNAVDQSKQFTTDLNNQLQINMDDFRNEVDNNIGEVKQSLITVGDNVSRIEQTVNGINLEVENKIDSSTALQLFYNFFALGIQDNTGAIISGINGDSSGLVITGKKIVINGDTTFLGKNFMDGAVIKNASIGEAQIIDASITNAKIANLDVNKLSGNVSNFIQSNWNGRYGSTSITNEGMTVTAGSTVTKFGNSGMNLTYNGQSAGGIGTQGFVGKPDSYQGLTFWLDGNAEYMGWAARDWGNTTSNPIIKMAWYRGQNAPSGAEAGFNFDDDVIFKDNINIPGSTTRKLKFGTNTFNNYAYPYFGDSTGQAGLAFGSAATYVISGSTYYNLTKVVQAFNNLGAVKIPTAITSDGKVTNWYNVTL